MSRRSFTLAVVTVATSALAACADPVTAPQRSQVAPGATSKDTFNSALCKSGWIDSTGRCG